MRILILTQYFWPESRTAPLNLGGLATSLANNGHEILVITGIPNHPIGKIYEGYKVKLWQWEQLEKVKILRLPLLPDHSHSIFLRFLNYSSFFFSAITLGLFLTRDFKPDVIFSYFAPVIAGLTSAVYKKFHQSPVVYWITDLWPENFQASGAVKNKIILGLLHFLEDWSYRQAEILCVDSPGYRNNLIQKKVAIEKIQIVAEWADENLFFPVDRDNVVGQELGLINKFNIIYGGNLGPVQGLDTVIKAASKAVELEDLQVVFIGDGNQEAHLKKMVKEYQISNVLFIPRQPMDRMRVLFAWADVLVVHLKNSPVFKLQLPSKVLAYMACGRPILNGVSGVVSEIVEDALCGLSCPPEDVDAMFELMKTFYRMPKEKLDCMGKKGREEYLRKYSRRVQVQKMETILQEVVDSHSKHEI